MGDWLGGRILDALLFILKDMRGTYSQEAWTSFAKLFSSPVAVLDDKWVQFFVRTSMDLALICLPVLIAYQAVRRILESMDGMEVTPAEVLVRRSLNAGLTVTGIALYGWLAATLADYMREVLGALPLQISLLETFFTGDDPKSGLAGLMLALAFLIGAGLVLIQRAILSAEFAVLLMIGAFLGLQKLTSDAPAAWQLWKREIVAVCVTPVLQLLLIYLFALRLMGGRPGEFTSWLEAFAMLYLLWNMPRWARQFTYSTGAGSMVVGAAAGATRLAVIRMMFKK